MFKKSNETSLIEEFYYPKYGPGEYYEEMASQIEKMGGVILYNSRVVLEKIMALTVLAAFSEFQQ